MSSAACASSDPAVGSTFSRSICSSGVQLVGDAGARPVGRARDARRAVFGAAARTARRPPRPWLEQRRASGRRSVSRRPGPATPAWPRPRRRRRRTGRRRRPRLLQPRRLVAASRAAAGAVPARLAPRRAGSTGGAYAGSRAGRAAGPTRGFLVPLATTLFVDYYRSPFELCRPCVCADRALKSRCSVCKA